MPIKFSLQINILHLEAIFLFHIKDHLCIPYLADIFFFINDTNAYYALSDSHKHLHLATIFVLSNL